MSGLRAKRGKAALSSLYYAPHTPSLGQAINRRVPVSILLHPELNCFIRSLKLFRVSIYFETIAQDRAADDVLISISPVAQRIARGKQIFMQLLNLKVERIIIHQVFQRGPDGQIIAPIQGHDFMNFDYSAMDAFKKRVSDALGEGSRAVQMEIVNQDAHKLPRVIDEIIVQDDSTFSVSSYDVAKMLADAQQSKGIPGGIVVVFSGTQGPNNAGFVGIIKAEVHTGYEKATNDMGEISLKFVEELLLTPAARLYKTAGFFERSNAATDSDDLNDKWAVMVSDSQINKADGKAAAQYFYADFLGCDYPETSARTTKHFYEATSKFISNMGVSASEKSDLFNALTTYLKVDTSPTISPSNFAESYFSDIDTQDAFTNFMKTEGLPDTAFTKDLDHIQSKLKFHSIKFRSNVKISAPSDTFKDLVTIETIAGDPDESGAPAEWTKITVKDRIVSQE